MNHQKIYDSIIAKAHLESRKKLKTTNALYVYYENHHIIPKCLNGSNDESNLVLLTAKEHYVCHKLLSFIYPQNRKIALAFFYMTYDKNEKRKLSLRDYAYAKELHSKFIWNRGLTKENNEIIKKQGEKRTQQFKDGKIDVSNFGIKTPQGLKNISEAQKNKPKSQKHRDKLSNALLGRSLSNETKNNMSKARKGVAQKQIQCPYCKLWGGTAMHRWHFENCKFKNNGTT